MKKIFLLITLLAMTVTSCNREDSHIMLSESSDQSQGRVIAAFETTGVTNRKFKDTHLYGFDANGKMFLHKYYTTQKELANELFQLESGTYTFIATLNVGQAFTPETRADASLHEVTMNQLMSYIKRVEVDYPDMLTGMITQTIKNNEVTRIKIPLSDKSGGIANTTSLLTATVTLPDAGFTEYQKVRTKAATDYELRGVMEFYSPQKSEPVHRASVTLVPTTIEGQYILTTEIAEGEYDLILWVDYTEKGLTKDLWYDTNSLQAVKLIADDKTYAASKDSREAFYYTGRIAITSGEAQAHIKVQRPQAKYILVTEDVKRYGELMVANPEKYVPLNELSVAIVYDSYLPDGFNVKDGKPNSSQQGYKCEKKPLPTIAETNTEVSIGSDYILVNGSESSVIVTVLVTDRDDRVVSRVQGLTIEYKRNMITTVRGDFLTAGVINPGINVDTDWDGMHDVEF